MPRTRVVVTAVLGVWVAACGRPAPPPVYDVTVLVPGTSSFHGVHGLRFDRDGALYAGSVISQSLFRIDIESGAVETFVGPPEGMADDLAIGPDGTFVWTAIEDGIVYARSPTGEIRRIMENQKGVNAVSFSPDGTRLFVSRVFYGDALYELDLSGETPARLILEDLGGLNAFQVAHDGMIYGPLVFGGRVVRIEPDTGVMTTVSDEFERPGALKLFGDGTALVLDGGTNGPKLKRVDVTTGETTFVAALPYDADNLAVNADARVFVSLSEVNAIVEVDLHTGDFSYVVEPSVLTMPAGLAVVTQDGLDTLFVGDGFGGVRLVDGQTGEVHDTPIELFMPTHLSSAGDHLIVGGEVLFGPIQRVHQGTFDVLGAWDGFDAPRDVLEAPNGDLVIAEGGAGRLVRLTETGTEGGDRNVIAEGLAGPSGLAWAGDDTVYVTETLGGRLVRVNLADRSLSVVASDLWQPEGVAVMPDGTVVVVEVGARRITLIDPASREQTVIASKLPLGLGSGPSLFRGVAASPSAIYVTADIGNAIYKLTPRAR